MIPNDNCYDDPYFSKDISFSSIQAANDNVEIWWYLKDLMLCYKFGEKMRFKRDLDRIKPYLSDSLLSLFEEVYRESMWQNPYKR